MVSGTSGYGHIDQAADFPSRLRGTTGHAAMTLFASCCQPESRKSAESNRIVPSAGITRVVTSLPPPVIVATAGSPLTARGDIPLTLERQTGTPQPRGPCNRFG